MIGLTTEVPAGMLRWRGQQLVTSFLRGRIRGLDALLDRRDAQRRLEDVRHQLLLAPARLELLEQQAEICQELGDEVELLAAYDELLAAYGRQKLYAHAIAVTKKILEVDPDREHAHAHLASLIDKADADERQRSELLATDLPTLEADQLEEIPQAPGLDDDIDELGLDDIVESDGDTGAGGPEAQARQRASTTLFSLFSTDALSEVLEATNLRSYASGDTVFREGEIGLSFFVIVEGSAIATTRNDEGALVYLGEMLAGELFGEVSILSGRPRAATVVAGQDLVTIEISFPRLQDIAGRHPEVMQVLRDFCERRAEQAIQRLVHRK